MLDRTANGKAIDSEEWPTATEAAAILGCSRQQVYKLEKDGRLHAKDARENGVKIRRFDPESVRACAESSELQSLLGARGALDDDDAPSGMRLAAAVVSESRQTALAATRAQQELVALIVKPSREINELLLSALKQREERIRELEGQLNAQNDEQRAARAEEREAALFANQLERADLRKDAFFKMFVENVPMVVKQFKASGGGPFVDWIRNLPQEKQQRLVDVVQSAINDEDQENAAAAAAPAASPPEKETGTNDAT